MARTWKGTNKDSEEEEEDFLLWSIFMSFDPCQHLHPNMPTLHRRTAVRTGTRSTFHDVQKLYNIVYDDDGANLFFSFFVDNLL